MPLSALLVRTLLFHFPFLPRPCLLVLSVLVPVFLGGAGLSDAAPQLCLPIPLSLVFALLYSSVAVIVIGRCFPSSTSPPISFCFRVSLLCSSLLASRPPLPEPSEPRVLPSRYRSSALRWSHVLVPGCGRLSLSQSLSVRWMLRPSLSTTFPSSPHHSPSTNPIFHRTLHSPIRIVHALKRAVKMCSQLRSPTPSHIFVLHCSYLTSSRTRSLAPCALSHSVRRRRVER